MVMFYLLNLVEILKNSWPAVGVLIPVSAGMIFIALILLIIGKSLNNVHIIVFIVYII